MTTPPLDPARARLTSGYGPRFRGSDLHTGIDLAAAEGEPVRAVRAGAVIVSAPSGELSRYGETIVVRHDSGEATLYAHLARRDVAQGTTVYEGQQIGTVGRTAGTRSDPLARTRAAHLHFELLRQWPPAGKDLDRIDPTRLWPPAFAAPSPRRARAELAPAVQTSAAAGGSGIVLLALWLWSRRRVI